MRWVLAAALRFRAELRRGQTLRMAPPGITEFDSRTTAIDGLLVLTTKRVEDERGVVREIYRESALNSVGSLGEVKQVNLTFSRRGALRGLHGEQMAKLVGLATGEGYGAYVDARPESPTLGEVLTMPLLPGTQVLVPAGVLNGFQAVSQDGCLYLYCFDQEWAPSMSGVNASPLDPALGIEWPVQVDPSDREQLSAKDAGLPSFADALVLAKAQQAPGTEGAR
jgi:dTDP-4-dehydrorhamnose 3,5-epimerase